MRLSPSKRARREVIEVGGGGAGEAGDGGREPPALALRGRSHAERSEPNIRGGRRGAPPRGSRAGVGGTGSRPNTATPIRGFMSCPPLCESVGLRQPGLPQSRSVSWLHGPAVRRGAWRRGRSPRRRRRSGRTRQRAPIRGSSWLFLRAERDVDDTMSPFISRAEREHLFLALDSGDARGIPASLVQNLGAASPGAHLRGFPPFAEVFRALSCARWPDVCCAPDRGAHPLSPVQPGKARSWLAENWRLGSCARPRIRREMQAS